MSDIIINPEYERLIIEVNKLKENIAELMEERDELVFHVCKDIEAKYMSEIGVLEYKLYEFQCKILRIKRKIELYQLRINRQEKINESEIETQLEVEYKQYQEKLNQMFKEIQDSLVRGSTERLSEEETKELKTIYRKLIKKLHPDLNSENVEKNRKLLEQVMHAYECADLKSLRNFELLISEIRDNEEAQLGELDDLRKKKDEYQTIIHGLIGAIKTIKNSYPYNMIEFLKNKDLINQKKIELNEEIEQCKLFYSELEEMLNELKGESDG